LHNPFDQMAKRVAREALAASGLVLVEHEISRDARGVCRKRPTA
jgi:hypothetical protein